MPRRTSAFTIAELLIALAITAVIGLTVAGVAMALSRSYQHSEQYYRYLQSGRVASIRLQGSLRKSRLVTASDASTLVLWAEDYNNDGQINVSEVLFVYYDHGARELIERSTVFPDSMSASVREMLDFTIPLSALSDPNVATGPPAYESYDSKRLLAAYVEDFQVFCTDAPPFTKLVKFCLKVGGDGQFVTMHGASRLRADRTEYVGEFGGEYVLYTTKVDPNSH